MKLVNKSESFLSLVLVPDLRCIVIVNVIEREILCEHILFLLYGLIKNLYAPIQTLIFEQIVTIRKIPYKEKGIYVEFGKCKMLKVKQ